MKDLQQRMTAAQSLLAPYAVPIAGTLGREHPQDQDLTRFPFQRDRDRIIHSPAFRRLKGKTQVFVAGIGDHYRTRLTHTMEVAQISRDIARTLGLNEDLAECIALAHDLGHPPFGHAGEEALDDWMQQHGSRFEHNEQSLRIVTLLDTHSSRYPGLNLNKEVLEGLMKHRTPHDKGVEAEEGTEGAEVMKKLSLEAQVVNLADEIAYTGHDCDDGVRAGLFTMEELLTIPVAKEAHIAAQASGVQLRGALIHMMVMDLYCTMTPSSIRFSDAMRNNLDILRKFLWDNMYMHPDVVRKTDEGKMIVTTLCDQLLQTPNDKVLELKQRCDCPLFASVKDYVAGMTDTFAYRLRFTPDAGR
ncbi:MAG: dNTP triphosphohydrolase [Candidatus Peregrinibacteria bacterium]|nr:dNTP triphosphohydrolase [Candidatus Peregrinibacteria bacterium]MCB9807801.1 dNTP triphosphohydrolase [Candidatus Peribacteria bacterium]